LKKEDPYFSIIIPTKNRPKLLERAIASVLAQEFEDFEIVVVDDHSENEPGSIIDSFSDKRIRLIQNQGKERSAARNAGIEFARGQYICFLDDDDEYESDYLADFYIFYQDSKNKDSILRTGFYRLQDNAKRKAPNYSSKSGKNPVHFFANNMCGVWSLSIPRKYLAIDKFPVEFPHWQDTHLILRLLAKHPFHQLDNYSYVYHIHQEMGSNLAMDPAIVETRLQLNIDAINHLFDHYSELVNPYLPANTRKKIIAGKYLHFASGVLSSNKNSIAFSYLKKSIRLGLYSQYWKYYGYVIKELIWPW
jgi:glycosyltransferase involved in cell wall biosynthesis